MFDSRCYFFKFITYKIRLLWYHQSQILPIIVSVHHYVFLKILTIPSACKALSLLYVNFSFMKDVCLLKTDIHAEYVSRIFYRIWISYVVKCSTTNSWLNILFYYIGCSYSIEYSWNIFCMYRVSQIKVYYFEVK